MTNYKKYLSQIIFILLISFFTYTAYAHTYASSTFTSQTFCNKIHVQFSADAISIIEMLANQKPPITDIDQDTFGNYAKIYKKYWQKHFIIKNNNQKCKITQLTKINYSIKDNKLNMYIIYDCHKKLDRLLIKNTMFIKEETSHKILGNFIHKLDKEHYVLLPGSTAGININRLRQPAATYIPKVGSYPVVSHPPHGYGKSRPSLPLSQKTDTAKTDTARNSTAATKKNTEPKPPDTATDNLPDKNKSADSAPQHNIQWPGALLLIIILSIALPKKRLSVLKTVALFIITSTFAALAMQLEFVQISPVLINMMLAAAIIYTASVMIKKINKQKIFKLPNPLIAVMGILQGFAYYLPVNHPATSIQAINSLKTTSIFAAAQLVFIIIIWRLALITKESSLYSDKKEKIILFLLIASSIIWLALQFII